MAGLTEWRAAGPTRSGPGARRCTASSSGSRPTSSRRSRPSPTWRCSRPASPAVAEFHYLHHQPDGRPYDDPREMSRTHRGGRRRSGIGLTLLPVLYARAASASPRAGPAPLRLRPRRLCAADGDARADGLHRHRAALAARRDARRPAMGGHATWRDVPAHIHVAEQPTEVEECLAAHGRRPVELLLDSVEADAAAGVSCTRPMPMRARSSASPGRAPRSASAR